MGITDSWGVTLTDLDTILSERPSVRGTLMGVIAEYKLQNTIFSDPRIRELKRYNDHNRNQPADFGFKYRNILITVEVKSLQTKSIKKSHNNYRGRCQVDASDRREVTLPNGSKITTTCLLPGKFDILAVNLFGFQNKWLFGFIRNCYLPRSTYKGYTKYQQENLLATSVPVTWPLSSPFAKDPFPILDEIVYERQNTKSSQK